MSATLRYDIGQGISFALSNASPGLLAEFGCMPASRWGGVHKSRFECLTFAVKLPSQIVLAVDLLLATIRAQRSEFSTDGTALNSCRTLEKKLRQSLGLPKGTSAEERPFVDAIMEGGDLTDWLVYADWLQERCDPRGDLIRAWSDPKKAIKVKYGIPVMARNDPKIS